MHERIIDLEKVIRDFETEKRRMNTRNATTMTQTIELEAELAKRGLLTAELKAQFEIVQSNVCGF